MNQKELKKLNISQLPGCYQFLDKKGGIIYIGKATNLHSRVLSYWRPSVNHSDTKKAMVKQVEKIKWIETDSEIAAFLLEANLIKKYQPHYNIISRDDKRFSYIKVSTEEDWPRIFVTRKIDKAGKYFGPFVSSTAVCETLKIIRKIWPYRTCARLPQKACLYYRIGKCPGMCEGRVSKSEYQKNIKQIILFLEGKGKTIKNYEKKINIVEARQGAPMSGNARQDSSIYNEEELNDLKLQLKNIKYVLANARIISVSEKYAADVLELAKVLSLSKIPERIEGYDISNIFGRQAVGSMVVFSDGEPDKSQYRKFKIKLFPGQVNDIAMLKEVLERRFKHISEVKLSIGSLTSNRWPLPDLIIIDGGKAQLNIALRVLKSAKFDIPVIAVSKGKGLRSAQAPDKIFFPGEKKPLELPLASPALHIIKRVRDEAHRFAIGYHKLLRRKRWLK